MTGTELAIPLEVKEELFGRRDEILRALPERIDVDHFIMVALMAVTKKPELQQCTIASVYIALLESARTGLMPDNREAALVPFGGQAAFMPMARGITRLMLRSPGILKVEARVVYEGDEFKFQYGMEPRVDHIPLKDGKADRQVTHAYAIVWRQGTDPTPEVAGYDEIEQARLTSKAPNAPHWKLWYGETARKVPLKRLGKYIDLSPEATRAIELDHALVGSDLGMPYVDGPSEDYQNQLTKSHTQAGIDRLKDQMANGDSEKVETESEPEPEPEKEPKPEEPKEATPRPKNKWEPDIINFLAETQLVDGKDTRQVKLHIRKVLNRSPFMDVPFGELDIVEATAFVLGRVLVIEEYPQLETKARYALLLEWWADEEKKQDLISRALKMVPPEEPSQ